MIKRLYFINSLILSGIPVSSDIFCALFISNPGIFTTENYTSQLEPRELHLRVVVYKIRDWQLLYGDINKEMHYIRESKSINHMCL